MPDLTVTAPVAQPSVLSGSAFATTLLHCEHCDGRHPQALIWDGASNRLYGLECMACNETLFWYGSDDMLRYIRAQLPEAGLDLGLVL